ncbi:lipoprotein insertase outer membrane protein LolB [Acidithiobacillus sp. AMEEHan]|uniref:lipoprotein insertase outer membrane protein LolB n=1 Tax=Acidithiobacillus sp. AMEEHan TaxID=2994951 RepID=UPI0027E44E5B|nr:lipoprotein insertase outer membrane protein LolB [Acidithiobacillus sp. AMEEHan]
MKGMLRQNWRMLAIPALLLLGACAQLPAPSGRAQLLLPAEQRAQVLASVHRWTATGQASLRSPRGSQSFGFVWRQQATGEQLRILGPLGNTVAELRDDGAQASLLEANGRHLTASTMSVLLERVLGVALPVAELPQWLLGIPPSGQVDSFDAAGLPERARWGGWQLQYLRYEAVGGLQMPALLQASGPDALQLRIAVSNWQLGQ